MKFTIKKLAPPAYTETAPPMPSPPSYDGDGEYAPETCGVCEKRGFKYNYGNNSMFYYQIYMDDHVMKCDTKQEFVCYGCCSKNDQRRTGDGNLFCISDATMESRTIKQIKSFSKMCVDIVGGD